MKKTVLVSLLPLLLTIGLKADSVSTATFSYSFSAAEQPCGNLNACSPFNLYVLVPPVNPADPGDALVSATWTITDYQQYYGGFNDVGQEPGQTFHWTTTEGDQITPLAGMPPGAPDITVSNTQDNMAVTTGLRQVGTGGFWEGNFLQASGALDVNVVNTLGGAAFAVTPFLGASPADNSNIWTALTIVQDYATLTVTAEYGSGYGEYGSEVPEPQLEFLVVLVVLAGIVWRRKGKQSEYLD